MTQSISIENAADQLNVPVTFLEQVCKQDKAHKVHHLTVYSKQIRFYPSDIEKIKKQLNKH